MLYFFRTGVFWAADLLLLTLFELFACGCWGLLGVEPLGSSSPIALSFSLLNNLFYWSLGNSSTLTKTLLPTMGTLDKRLEISIHPILCIKIKACTFFSLLKQTRFWIWNDSSCFGNQGVAHITHRGFWAKTMILVYTYWGDDFLNVVTLYSGVGFWCDRLFLEDCIF